MHPRRNSHGIAYLLTLAALSGGIHTQAEAPPAESGLTLPSGATLKVATDWTVTELKDGLTLQDPEKELRVEVVEVDSAELSASIVAAWSRRVLWRPWFCDAMHCPTVHR